ncbi:DNA-binding protein [Marinobacterium marinum]|uniref:DNA-binding protein n=1 Tax=Marinobacterium marinum TaxID=2756129 RepID=A0A7W2AC84_9GAMM|nr:DNA-binding protein [Marinobacterium marinum]MBA4501868.1 DNA-binding protein [Marinobacterium marinum]
MDSQFRTKIFTLADQSLLSGEMPTLEGLEARLSSAEPAEIERLLVEWRAQLPSRVRLQELTGPSTAMGVPDSMQQLFVRVWRQAVQEASEELGRQAPISDPASDEKQRACDDALKRARDEIAELEQRYREQAFKLSQSKERQTELETELQQVRNEQSAENAELKKEEQLRASAVQELEQLRKTYEDAQRVFDQRVRDEQRHNLEALARAEVDTRHYRNALEKLRDESGRKEADLTRELNELRARLARSDAKSEALGNQLRTQDEVMRGLQSQDAQQQREQAQMSAQLLSAANRNKRTEEQVKQLEERLQAVSQKQVETSSDSARREAQLRAQLQQREDDVLKIQVRAQAAEQRAEALEEEVRRIKQRA